MDQQETNNEPQNVEMPENVEMPQNIEETQMGTSEAPQNSTSQYTEKMRKQAVEKLQAIQKTMLKMNPDSIMFKPVSLLLLIGIIIIYWLFFGMVYQNEYFKNASIFWVMIITFSFLIFSK